MRFLVYNIRYATGHNNGYHLPLPYAGFFRSTRQNLDEIIEFLSVYAPDVIGLVEVDSGSYRSGRTCQAELIAHKRSSWRCTTGESTPLCRVYSSTPVRGACPLIFMV